MENFDVRAMIASFPTDYAASRGLTNQQLEVFAESMLAAYKERRRLQEEREQKLPALQTKTPNNCFV